MVLLVFGFLVISTALVVNRRLVRAQVQGRADGFRLGDAAYGLPHHYGEGLRRINIKGELTAQLARASLESQGIEARVNTFGGGWFGQLDCPTALIYQAEDELEVLEVVQALDDGRE